MAKVIRRTKQEREISEAFKLFFDRIQVPMLDLPKIFKACRERNALGEKIEDVMKELAGNYGTAK